MRSQLKGKRRSLLLRCTGMNVPTPHGVARTTMTCWVEVEVSFELPKEDTGVQEMGEGLDRRGLDRPGDEQIQEVLKTTATETAERVCELIRVSNGSSLAAAQAELDFSLSSLRQEGL